VFNAVEIAEAEAGGVTKVISENELTGVHGRNTLFSKLISTYAHIACQRKLKKLI
jgi:hypothetical protein